MQNNGFTIEELNLGELYDCLKSLDTESYRAVFKKSTYTQKQLALMIHSTESALAAWSVGRNNPNKPALKLLILEIIARRKGFSSVEEIVMNADFNDKFKPKIRKTRKN